MWSTGASGGRTIRLRYSGVVWARVHKIDRVRPQPGGGAIILVEDERSAGQMARRLPLSILIAIARVLNAHHALDKKYGGKGEVRYATNAKLPPSLFEAVQRAGAAVSDRTGERLDGGTSPASVSSTIDLAFAHLANDLRTTVGAANMQSA